MDCKCMILVAVGWCRTKWLRFDQTIKNLTSGNLRISLVVIQLGVIGLKKARLCISYTCFREGRKKGSVI